jgi:hypothetical protein
MRILGSVLFSIDDADLNFQVYKKKKSRLSNSSHSKLTHQPITSQNSPPALQTSASSSLSSPRHHRSNRRSRNRRHYTMSDSSSTLPPFEFCTRIDHSRLILQTPSGDAQEICCTAMEHCLQYNLFLRNGRNPTSNPEPLGYAFVVKCLSYEPNLPASLARVKDGKVTYQGTEILHIDQIMGPKPIPPPTRSSDSPQLPHDTMGILSDPECLNVASRAVFNALGYTQCSKDIQKHKIAERIEKKRRLEALGLDKTFKLEVSQSRSSESSNSCTKGLSDKMNVDSPPTTSGSRSAPSRKKKMKAN